MISLDDRIECVHGIGPRWAGQLAELGVERVRDLLDHLPFRYVDRRTAQPLREAREGEPLVAIATVEEVAEGKPTRRRGIEVLDVLLADESATLRAVFYGRSYLADYLEEGACVLVQGTPRFGRRGLELRSPEFELLRDADSEEAATGWVPIYEKLGPLTPRRLRTVVANALHDLGAVDDPIPDALRARRRLVPRRDAYAIVHAPAPETPAEDVTLLRTRGHRRLAYDEFFLLELGLAMRRRHRQSSRRGVRYEVDDALDRELVGLLPFELTGAQRRTLDEIRDDLRQSWPMNRLLMGDVGSGKTAVAALAMMIAVRHRAQAALMAPTEILARQHAATLSRLLDRAQVHVDLLTAGLPSAEQRAVRGRIASGQARLVVGTHSLISDKVRFARLGLCVIDEQQRFGVAQRSELSAKGDNPDVLVMSATPIPRTLAMVSHGDLDISILDEKPPGRKPIRTVVRRDDERPRVFAGLERALAEKRRVYVVRPAVEEGRGAMRAAEEGATEYRARFPDASVALVHGKQKAEERQAGLDAFAEGRAQILVATTVIEVGIDVPQASVIVVEDADRFGLAQLHQLRGRVGRGDLKSYCVLVASEDAGEEALDRLRVLELTDDGFRVAEEDLARRGPGDLAGTAQHGMPRFRVADVVRHKDMLFAAREDAFRLLERTEGRGLPADLFHAVMERHGERLKLVGVG